MAEEDKSKPSPKGGTPSANSGETVAPDIAQSELTLRKVEDLLRDNKVTPEDEARAGMSKEEMEQFVKKFRKPPQGRARQGPHDRRQAGGEQDDDPPATEPSVQPRHIQLSERSRARDRWCKTTSVATSKELCLVCAARNPFAARGLQEQHFPIGRHPPAAPGGGDASATPAPPP